MKVQSAAPKRRFELVVQGISFTLVGRLNKQCRWGTRDHAAREFEGLPKTRPSSELLSDCSVMRDQARRRLSR